MDELNILGLHSFSPDFNFSPLLSIEGDPGAGGGGGGTEPVEVVDTGADAGAGEDGGAAATPAEVDGAVADAAAPTAAVTEDEILDAAAAPAAAAEVVDPAAKAVADAAEAARVAKLSPAEQAQETALNEVYKTHPEVKEFLAANPSLKPFWFKASEFNKMFRTVEDARDASEYATELHGLQELYFSKDPKATAQFTEQLWRNSLADPTKEYHPASNPSDGSYERVAEHVTSQTFASLHRLMAANGNPEWREKSKLAGWTPEQTQFVIEGLSKILGYKVGGGAGAQLPPATAGAGPQTEYERNLLAREAALRTSEAEVQSRAESNFQSGLAAGINGYLDAEVTKVFKPAEAALAKLPAFVQTQAREHIRTQVLTQMQGDVAFQRALDTAARQGSRDAAHADRIATMLRDRASLYFEEIAGKVLRELGVSAIAKAGVVAAKAGAAAARREPSTGNSSAGRLSRGPAGAPTKHTGNYDKDFERIVGGL